MMSRALSRRLDALARHGEATHADERDTNRRGGSQIAVAGHKSAPLPPSGAAVAAYLDAIAEHRHD